MNKRLRPCEAPLASLRRLFAALAMVACLLASPFATTPALAEDQAPTPELTNSYSLGQLGSQLLFWLVTDDGSHALIATWKDDYDSFALYAVDTTTGEASSVAQQDTNYCTPILLSNTSALVYDTSSQGAFLYDLESGEKTDLPGLTFESSPYRARLMDGGDRLALVGFDASSDDTMYSAVVYDLKSQQLTSSFNVTTEDAPISCVLSSDGSTLYVLDGDSPYHVVAYDMATGTRMLDQATSYSGDSGRAFLQFELEDGSLVVNTYPNDEHLVDSQYRLDPETGELSPIIDGTHDVLAMNQSTTKLVYLTLVNQNLPADQSGELTSDDNRDGTSLASVDAATGDVLYSMSLPTDFSMPANGYAFVSQDGRYATMLHQDSDDSPLTLRTYDVSTGASSEVELSGMDSQSVEGVLTNDDREVALLAVDDDGVFTLSTYDTGYGGNGLFSNPLVIAGIVAAVVVVVGIAVVVVRRRRWARRAKTDAPELTGAHPQSRFCPNCGRELANTNARFCPSCGHKINS